MALATVILADAIDRLRDRLVFYCDAGMFPRVVIDSIDTPLTGLAQLIGSPASVTLLFVVGLGAALLVLVGLGGRVAVAVLWLYVVTVNTRADLVADGGDGVMEAMTFWLLFAESDAAWSLRRGPRVTAIRALPVRLLELQLGLIYFVAGVRKLGPEWLGGKALFHVLQNNDFARPLGMALLDHPSLCTALTYATLVVELGFLPLMLLWPRRGRVLAVLMAAGLHVGIFGLMRVGMFSFVMLASLTLLVPMPHASTELPWPRRQRVIAIVAVTLFVMATASAFLRQHTPAPMRTVLVRLGITQGWSMFAWGNDSDGYWSGTGRFTDGSSGDVLQRFAPQMLPQAETGFSRWYKLRNNMIADDEARLMLLDWICRQDARLVEATLTRWDRPVREADAAPHAFTRADETRWRCRVR